MSVPAHLPSSMTVARRLLGLVLGLVVLSSALAFGPEPTQARRKHPGRATQLAFMWAMAGQESGWDYYSRNASSGAFGKYQIMPFNWPNWAEKYLGDRHADQTPANQERVAYGKLRDLYHWLGSWRRVAHWWLTGSSEPDEKRWSSYALGYVRNIMALRRRAPADGDPSVRPADGSLLERGDWRRMEETLKLRTAPSGRPWRRGGRTADGEVVKIRAARRYGDGHLWLLVVTVDGRLGWVKAVRTVPSRAPQRPSRWSDVRTDGRGGEQRRGAAHKGKRYKERQDRSKARPKPR